MAKKQKDVIMLPAAPRVTVMCVGKRCVNANKTVAIDAGVMLADGVMASYAPSCLECGSSMQIVGPAE